MYFKEAQMAKTQDDLQAAFAGESQANRKYLAFAEKAEREGYKRVAKLFRATAEAETVHAHSHLRALGGIKSTKENLEAAIGGETYEFEKMYPPMIEQARAEGNKKAEMSFNYANEVEKGQEDRLTPFGPSPRKARPFPPRGGPPACCFSLFR
jgi:rubrerythrin